MSAWEHARSKSKGGAETWPLISNQNQTDALPNSRIGSLRVTLGAILSTVRPVAAFQIRLIFPRRGAGVAEQG
jgi:hypothetical protein